jgi:NAD+-dependent protein deacetylase SIR2
MSEVVQAHGANFGATCSKCGKAQDRNKLIDGIKSETVVYCASGCGGPVKPDITFFGEGLPGKFFAALNEIVEDEPDLLIVIGTALAVSPFNTIVDLIPDNVPKVLINLENTKNSGYDFDEKEKYPNRLFMQGKCDDVIKEIAAECGWINELNSMCAVKSLEKQLESLDLKDVINSAEEKKEEKVTEDEIGPIMGMHAVEPLKECPHCIPGVHILPIEEFVDCTIKTPCKDCGHTKENWICL